MPVRRILELGDPLLREVSFALADVQEAIPTLLDLRDTLHEFQRTHGFGRGIAAIQIGIPQRVIYIEIAGQAYELIHPAFEFLSEEKFKLWDDCFSFPNLMVHLERSKAVSLRYEGRDGTVRRIDAVDAFAELLQHEMDHLDGILSIDRALDAKHSLMTRSEYLRTLEKNQLSRA